MLNINLNKGESMIEETINKLIAEQKVLIYKTRTGEEVKGYITKKSNSECIDFCVYAPSRLNDFQTWSLTIENLLSHSTLSKEKASWGFGIRPYGQERA